jgi:hypothetical protein
MIPAFIVRPLIEVQREDRSAVRPIGVAIPAENGRAIHVAPATSVLFAGTVGHLIIRRATGRGPGDRAIFGPLAVVGLLRPWSCPDR